MYQKVLLRMQPPPSFFPHLPFFHPLSCCFKSAIVSLGFRSFAPSFFSDAVGEISCSKNLFRREKLSLLAFIRWSLFHGQRIICFFLLIESSKIRSKKKSKSIILRCPAASDRLYLCYSQQTSPSLSC